MINDTSIGVAWDFKLGANQDLKDAPIIHTVFLMGM